MRAGDLVSERWRDVSNGQDLVSEVGIVIETGVNMWGEEAVPSGVRVLWSDGEIDVSSEDDIVLMEQ